MKDLKELTNLLVAETDKSRQVEILQKINEKLLTEYVIKISDEFIVYPLHVEAYYYHPGKFEDENTHGFKTPVAYKWQSDRFGKLYSHIIGWGGVDICLSDGDYCLSFLIKASKIKKNEEEPVFIKQTGLYNQLNKTEGIKEKQVLAPDEKKIRSTKYIFQTIRKGLKNETFKEEKLAALTELERKYNHTFAFETGHGKRQLVRDYMKLHHIMPAETGMTNIEREIFRMAMRPR
ncbi:MAG: hypothetical protein LBS88_07335 [Tannerellaceae bacterium]|jgi:hypothetical protein|nr:hypothetical protein [Tannerellaceae bacterium]